MNGNDRILTARLRVQILVDYCGDNETDTIQERAFLNEKSALLQLVEESPVSKTIVL